MHASKYTHLHMTRWSCVMNCLLIELHVYFIGPVIQSSSLSFRPFVLSPSVLLSLYHLYLRPLHISLIYVFFILLCPCSPSSLYLVSLCPCAICTFIPFVFFHPPLSLLSIFLSPNKRRRTLQVVTPERQSLFAARRRLSTKRKPNPR